MEINRKRLVQSVYAGYYVGTKVVVKVLEEGIDDEDVQKEASVVKMFICLT